MRPLVSSELRLYPLDADLGGSKVVCEVPSADGRAFRYALPKNLVPLIELCDGRRTIDQVVTEYRASVGTEHQPERLKRLIDEFLIPKGLVAPSPEVAPARSSKPRRSFLHLQVRLLGPRLVDPLARRLAWAFRRPVLISAVALFVATHAFFYLAIFPAAPLDFDRLDSVRFLALLAITTISALVHEMGHVSAASYYGCRRFEVGWGLYLVFTVLYSDVSDAWKLPRRHRAVVDLGGIYFQSTVLVVLALLAWATGDPLWAYGFLVTDFSIAASLNPFLRLDGYWLMSDLAGIPNLRQHSLRIWRRLLPGGDRDRLPLSRKTAVVLALYTLAGTAFFVWLAVVLTDRVVVSLTQGYPHMIGRLREVVSAAPFSLAETLSASFELLWRTVVLGGLLFLVFRFAWRLAAALGRFSERWRLRPTIDEAGGS